MLAHRWTQVLGRCVIALHLNYVRLSSFRWVVVRARCKALHSLACLSHGAGAARHAAMTDAHEYTEEDGTSEGLSSAEASQQASPPSPGRAAPFHLQPSDGAEVARTTSDIFNSFQRSSVDWDSRVRILRRP